MFALDDKLPAKVPFEFVVAVFVAVKVAVVLFDDASIKVLVAMHKIKTPASNLYPARIPMLARCCRTYEQVLVLFFNLIDFKPANIQKKK